MGAIGAKFYKSATPPPGSSQPPPSQSNSNTAPKEVTDISSTNKAFGQNINTKVPSTNSNSTEKSSLSNTAKTGK